MDYPAAYDITRLTSRFLQDTPNGIDRVDMMLARYFLGAREAPCCGMVFLPRLGHRVVSRQGALEAIDALSVHFGEADDPDSDPAYRRVRAWLVDGEADRVGAPQRVREPRDYSAGKTLRWLARHGGYVAQTARRRVPAGARYIDISQYPLATDASFAWRAARPDVKSVFFVHDMLPFEMPEYFPKPQVGAHQRRLRNLARHAAGAIVSTLGVRQALQSRLAEIGRPDLPILVAPLPVSPIFLSEDPAQDFSAQPFFIQCGTLEPRKNHLLTLQLWRELVARHGPAAPKLVLVGARGWENQNVFNLLDRSPALRGHVLEVAGLSTPGLRRLLKGARALLAPSFGEGYGLPLAEALALGTPTIAADIATVREIAGQSCTRLSPIDGAAWLAAIEQFTDLPLEPAAIRAKGARTLTTPEAFCRAVDEFVASV